MSAEDDLINRVFAPIAGPGGLALLDDAGLVGVPAGCELVVTADAIVAGVHFFAADPPGSIAIKALGVNLSDLAAKAARPCGFLLTLALPTACDEAWVGAFAGALGVQAERSRCPLIGGDTVSTAGALTVSITALGLVEAGAMLRRTRARAGDIIYVSGTIGDGTLGLEVRRFELEGASQTQSWTSALRPCERAHLSDRYLHPQPRLALGLALRHAHAGMDVSDGLVGDLLKMLRVSGVGGLIETSRIPLSQAAAAAAAADPSLVRRILTGGDDYEILATVPVDAAERFENEARTAGVAVTAIGRVTEGKSPAVFIDADGSPLVFGQTAFSHR